MMMVLVTSWYAAAYSDRTYHMRVTEYNAIHVMHALKNKALNRILLCWGIYLPQDMPYPSNIGHTSRQSQAKVSMVSGALLL